MTKKARVLVASLIGLAHYSANAVIELDDKLAAQLEKQGVIDTNPAAVAYAIEEGAEVQKHVSSKKSAPQKTEETGNEIGQDDPQNPGETQAAGNDDKTGVETNPTA